MDVKKSWIMSGLKELVFFTFNLINFLIHFYLYYFYFFIILDFDKILKKKIDAPFKPKIKRKIKEKDQDISEKAKETFVEFDFNSSKFQK